MRFEGSMVAVVTPMRDGRVDLGALRELVEWQIAEGTDGIVPCGTTGENVTLSAAERVEVIRAVVETVRGRVPVIAGAGSNSTRECVEAVQAVKALRVDAALVVTPYYNRPTQEGLLRHYGAIFEATHFPMIAYNVPSRTGCDLLPATLARLVEAGTIVGIKDATGRMDRQLEHLEKIGRDATCFLSGDDATIVPYVACGGHGVISVVANVAPRKTKELVSAARKGELSAAGSKQSAMAELVRSLFIESNPGPVKAALHLMGRIGPELRLPLVQVSEATLGKVREALVHFGIRVG